MSTPDRTETTRLLTCATCGWSGHYHELEPAVGEPKRCPECETAVEVDEAS